MARHRRRRHRGFRDYVSVPQLGDLKAINPLGKHVGSNGVFVGAAGGLALGAVVKYLINKANVALGGKIPATILSYAGPISTFLGGVGLALAAKKFMKGKGMLGLSAANSDAILVGASVAAFSPLVWKLLGDLGPKLSDGTPFFSDYVMTNYGLLTSDGQLKGYGLLTRDAALSGYGSDDAWDPMTTP